MRNVATSSYERLHDCKLFTFIMLSLVPEGFGCENVATSSYERLHDCKLSCFHWFLKVSDAKCRIYDHARIPLRGRACWFSMKGGGVGRLPATCKAFVGATRDELSEELALLEKTEKVIKRVIELTERIGDPSARLQVREVLKLAGVAVRESLRQAGAVYGSYDESVDRQDACMRH